MHVSTQNHVFLKTPQHPHDIFLKEVAILLFNLLNLGMLFIEV